MNVGGRAEASDVIFTFSYETWDDAQRRGMMRPPDRIAQVLIDSPRVRRLVVANPSRWAPSAAIRRLLGRDRPFPETRGRSLAAPVRWSHRRDPVDVDRLVRAYRDYGRTVSRVARRRGLRDPALVTTHPLVAAFAEIAPPDRTTYFGRDDWASFPGREEYWPAYRAAYERLAGTGVAVVAVSEQIVERIAPTGPSLVLPNAVDPVEWRGEAPPEPALLGGLGRPRLVYAGTVDDRLDVEGLRAVAERRPDVEIVVVGPVGDPDVLAAIDGVPGIHHRPGVGRAELVATLRHCDVGLVAHRRSPLTEAMSPLKAYEYLAAGLPVVSTDLAPMRGLGHRVLLAETVAGFADLLPAALGLGRQTEPERYAFLERNSWAHRYGALVDLALRTSSARR